MEDTPWAMLVLRQPLLGDPRRRYLGTPTLRCFCYRSLLGYSWTHGLGDAKEEILIVGLWFAIWHFARENYERCILEMAHVDTCDEMMH